MTSNSHDDRRSGNLQLEELIAGAIGKIAVGPNRGRDISRRDARAIAGAMLAGQVDEVQLAVLLIGLRMKSEAPEELAGLLEGMQAAVTPVVVDVDELWILADPFDGYLRCIPVTPFIPPILAACNMPCVMHGVERLGPKYGVTAEQVYRLAGIDTDMGKTAVAGNLTEWGWAYISQKNYAPALYALSSLRNRIIKRTALTTLERVLMPLSASGETHLTIGFVHKAYLEIYSALACQNGFASALLIKGIEGGLAPALSKPLRTTFADFQASASARIEKHVTNPIASDAQARPVADLNRAPELAVQQCLQQGISVLAGNYGIARDSLCLAAGVIIHAHGRANSLAAAVEKVENSLDNGLAESCFNKMITNT